MPIYGIDLGTTNSLIGLHETGYLSDIVPSCANLETGEAGVTQYENMNAKRSFKVDISMGLEGIGSRAASTLVLKELVKKVKEDTGNTVTDVAISVPAYFNDAQRAATIEAAKDAGLTVHSLVNEPTAAAMFIAVEKKGLFVVYDLGGGTFDTSIIDSRFGTFDVQASSGRTIGGDNFDKNIMKNIIKGAGIPIHHLMPEDLVSLQHFASKVKVRMQKEQSAFEIDLTPWKGGTYLFTPETYVSIMKITFSDTIDCMLKLISTWIPETEVFEILLVGGSTHCPYLRKWIEECTRQKTAPLTYDPDRAVAKGAALYADIVSKGELGKTVSDVTKELSIGLHDGTVQVVVPANSKIPLSMEHIFTNPIDATKLSLDLYQGESMFIKDNECIGQLVWDYEEMKPAQFGQVIVEISIDVNGIITFSARELLKPPKTVVLNRK